MNLATDLYRTLGVEAHKGDVCVAWQKAVQPSEYPLAFCSIVQDSWDPKWVMTNHTDGTGSKTLTRALYALVTRDRSVFGYEPDDGLSMNTGDAAASGFVRPPYVVADTIGINSDALPKYPILLEIAGGFRRLASLYEQYGLGIVFIGGETADLPDQIRSMVFDMNVFARMPRTGVIDGNVQVGDQIFGFRSDGQAVWEDTQNSGHMSNGSTLTRFVLAHEDYGKQYPKLFRTEKLPQGRYRPGDTASGLDMTVWEAMMSPTRQWAIVIKMLIDELEARNSRHLLHGIVMNTGGGLTKCLRVGRGITYRMLIPEFPPIFKLIQNEAGVSLGNMFTTYNCGIGLVVIGSPESGILQAAIGAVSEKSSVAALLLGSCSQSRDEENHVIIHTRFTTHYDPHLNS